MPATDEARLVDLETRFAYQEATLRDLNDIIARQQKQIDQLEKAYRALMERTLRAEQGSMKGAPEDEIPPHY